MSDQEQATALVAEAAQTLYDTARAHKRSEGYHRKQARTCMQQLDDIKRACKRLGITLTIHEAKETLHGPRDGKPDTRSSRDGGG